MSVILLLFLTSCSDQGCIEADDFGEYDQEFLEIKANGSADLCLFDATKKLDDPAQGSGIRKCLVSGNAEYTDYDSGSEVIYTSTSGCNGLTKGGSAASESIKIQCARYSCVEKCQNNSSYGNGSVEPDWVATHRKESGSNYGITVSPGAEIYIRAIGEVTLSGNQNSLPMIVKSTRSLPNSSKENSNSEVIYDVLFGDSKAVKFSGKWIDGGPDSNLGNANNIIIGTGSISDDNGRRSVYAAAKRLVAYVIPHPEGYAFDYSGKNDEKSGTIGVPLNPDPDFWSCTGGGQSGSGEIACNSINYKNGVGIGYENIDDKARAKIDSLYAISSTFKTQNLGLYGGMIRWKGDQISPSSIDPFAGITNCNKNNTPACSNMSSLTSDRGMMIINSSNLQITNTTASAQVYSLKNLSSDASCNLGINVEVRDKNNKLISSNSVDVFTSSWSKIPVDIEQGDVVTIAQPAIQNCGKVIGLRYDRLHDIEIQRSGLVSFANIGTVGANGECNLQARIINPSGTRTGSNADFYEYANNNSDLDPLSGVIVSASQPLLTNEPFAKSFSTSSAFVRKGQKIRFYPESWNNKWNFGNDGVVNRYCGIGIAMKIEPRPAFLCRGVASEKVNNPNCVPKVDKSTGQIIGCEAIAMECSDSKSNYYCPKESCQSNWSDSCGSISSVTQAKCNACQAKKIANGAQNYQIDVADLPQCYDLENYQGKVSNINLDNGFSDSELNDPNVAKGAKKILPFDGSYGNFTDLAETSEDGPATNKVYRLKNPVTFKTNGRLKFLFLDGNNFKKFTSDYSNNGNDPVPYDGSNGYRVDLAGKQQYSNGAMLEAVLCGEPIKDKKDSSETYECSSAIMPVPPLDFPGSNQIVKIDPSTIDSQNPKVTSDYKFDSAGNLLRIATPDDGVYYYQHKYQFFTDEQLKAKSDTELNAIKNLISHLRISFKIKDPDENHKNCIIPGPDPSNQNPPSCTSNCTGIKGPNPSYDSSKSSNAGGVCPYVDYSLPNPPICQKQFVCTNIYANNSGSYNVVVKVKNKGSGVSNIVNGVVGPVVEVMDGKLAELNPDGTEKTPAKMGQAERVYKMVITDARYQSILTICMVMMITFYGVGYLMGVSEFSQAEIISRVIKIGIIYLFVGPTGWFFFDKFFVETFKHGTDYLAFTMASSFDRSKDLQDAINTGNYTNKAVLFSSVDKVFGLFFSSAVQKKVSALLFASIFGWAYLVIIYFGFILYVYAVANAILIYLTSQIFISILFIMGPLFLIFLLFNQTKEMFDKWLSELISFSLQQIFLLVTLTFFNMMMYEVIKFSLGYRVCWDDVWVIHFVTNIKLLSFWTISGLPNMPGQEQIGNVRAPGIPSIFSILLIWLIASLMKRFIEFMTNLAAMIGGGVSASDLASGARGAINSAVSSFKSSGIAKMFDTGLQKIDRSLFDSGKLADQERDVRKRQNRKDFSNKNSLLKSGDKAVRDYKEKNANHLATLTDQQKAEELKGIRDSAIVAQGKRLGLSEAEVERLKSDKGLKYEDHNLIGASLAALKQQAANNRGVTQSINDKKVDTSLSKDGVAAAFKNESKEGREELFKNIQQGNLEVRKGVVDRGLNSIKESLGSVKNFVDDKDYNEARDQAVERGEVRSIRKGFNWARTDEEKNTIKGIMEQNKANRKIDAKNNSDDKILDALKAKDLADSLDESESSQFVRKEGTLASAILGREKGVAKQTIDKVSDLLKKGVGKISGKDNKSDVELSDIDDGKKSEEVSLKKNVRSGYSQALSKEKGQVEEIKLKSDSAIDAFADRKSEIVTTRGAEISKYQDQLVKPQEEREGNLSDNVLEKKIRSTREIQAKELTAVDIASSKAVADKRNAEIKSDKLDAEITKFEKEKHFRDSGVSSTDKLLGKIGIKTEAYKKATNEWEKNQKYKSGGDSKSDDDDSNDG